MDVWIGGSGRCATLVRRRSRLGLGRNIDEIEERKMPELSATGRAIEYKGLSGYFE